MTEAEIADLLLFASHYDNRHLSEEETQAWHLTLRRLNLDDAKAAVAEHYQHDSRRLMPADVFRYYRASASATSPGPVPAKVDVAEGVTVLGADRMRQATARGRARNRARRDCVLRHPDLARRLTEFPLGFKFPEQWDGFVPPPECQDEAPEGMHSAGGLPNGRGRRTGGTKPNDSERRAVLVDICAEAWRREHQQEHGGAA